MRAFHWVSGTMRPSARTRAGLPSSCGGVLFAVAFVGFWSAITLAFDVMLVYAAYRQLAATRYPSTIGAVSHSEVKEHSDGDGSTYRPEIKYLYRVGEREYTGDRYRYGQMASGDRHAHRVVNAHPVGRELAVYYNPADPADAVLLTGLEGSDLFLAVFLTPFNMIMLAGWWVCGRWLRTRFWRPPAGGARIVERGFRTRVRYSDVSPLAVAAATMAAVAFISTFVIGFSLGFNPPLEVAVADWTLILGAAAAIYAWRRVRSPGELVIDEVGRTLTLPPRKGRRNELVIPHSSIRAIEVASEQQKGSEGDWTESFVPAVHYIAENGAESVERLDKKQDRAEAEGLAEWLRERLGLEPGGPAPRLPKS